MQKKQTAKERAHAAAISRGKTKNNKKPLTAKEKALLQKLTNAGVIECINVINKTDADRLLEKLKPYKKLLYLMKSCGAVVVDLHRKLNAIEQIFDPIYNEYHPKYECDDEEFYSNVEQMNEIIEKFDVMQCRQLLSILKPYCGNKYNVIKMVFTAEQIECIDIILREVDASVSHEDTPAVWQEEEIDVVDIDQQIQPKKAHLIPTEKLRETSKIINNKSVDEDKFQPKEMIKSSVSVDVMKPQIQPSNPFRPTSPKISFGERNNIWGEKRPVSRTSSLASKEEKKEPRPKREGSVHSKSRINIGGVTFDETRTGKGRSTSREFSIGNKVIEGKHPELKRVASQLRQSSSSSRFTHEDQLKKREENLNKKFEGMSLGGK